MTVQTEPGKLHPALYLVIAAYFELLKTFAYFTTYPLVCRLLEPFGKGTFKNMDSFHLNTWTYIFLPLVGLSKSLVIVGFYQGLLALGVPNPYAAFLAAITYPIQSGHLHQDGFADTVDALHAMSKPPRQVMTDPCIGAIGAGYMNSQMMASTVALAGVLHLSTNPQYLLGIVVLLTAIKSTVFPVAFNASNLKSGVIDQAVTDLPHNVLGYGYRTYYAIYGFFLLLGVGVLLYLSPEWVLAPLVGTIAGIYALRKVIHRFGFLQGDMLGAYICVAELVGLLTLLVLLATTQG